MKKIIILMIAMILLAPVSAAAKSETVNGAKITVTATKNKVTVKWRWKKYKTFRIKGAKVVFISERNLTERKLLTRKAKRIVYVERCIGRVTTNDLDGVTTNGEYISYRSLRGYARKGDEVLSYFVYDPTTTWIDDSYRFDVIL